ncbi:MAG: dCMP deaminase family protein [Erysipelothrix sp.]|nr:dCMP deaminase family protein [Erysipelothrix sp.]
MSKKRLDVLSWDEYFMSVAHLSALRSKDPNTQVGACIVNEDNIILGIGYNGLPKGCSDDEFPWGNVGDTLDTKYAFVVHAELNAILNSHASLKGASIYVSLFPCNECAKAIIQSGITLIVYEDDKYADTDAVKASKRMLAAAGVAIRQVEKRLLVKVEEVI